MKKLITVSARSKSTRLPGKIYKDIGGMSMLERVYNICKAVGETAVLGVDTDEELKAFCKAKDLKAIFAHVSEDDLVARLVYAMKSESYEGIVRVTSDCPLLPVQMLQAVYDALDSNDYVTNVSPRSFPDGWDAQAASKAGMDWVDQHQNMNREHPFIGLDNDPCQETAFAKSGLKYRRIVNSSMEIWNPFLIDTKISVDTEEDLDRVSRQFRKVIA